MQLLPPPLSGLLMLWDDRRGAASGAVNMAVDEALLAEAVRTGTSFLRFYRWDRPTLSFGYFLTESAARRHLCPGEAMVRRWTGGGIVHHDQATTWTLAVPATDAFYQTRPSESYFALHQSLAQCLTAAGLHGINVAPPNNKVPTGGVCSESPAPGDLIRDGQKIAGAGQRRTRHGLLHQGVIFMTGSDLPHDLPECFAGFLSPIHTVFPAGNAEEMFIPRSKYEDPGWNSLR